MRFGHGVALCDVEACVRQAESAARALAPDAGAEMWHRLSPVSRTLRVGTQSIPGACMALILIQFLEEALSADSYSVDCDETWRAA